MALDDSGSGAELYRKLPLFAETRRKELLARLQPVLDVADLYGELISRAVLALGQHPPSSRQDVVVRDLTADVFDFLYEWPRPLFEGRLQVAYPLARRAFESLSLLSACYQDAAIAARWDGNKQIGNADVRALLEALPFNEDLATLREAYRAFSQGAHPNRGLVSERFLGAGNEFVLGAIGQPEFVLVLEQCIYLIDLWFWFGAVLAHVAKEYLSNSDPSFGKDYMAAAEQAAEVKRWLVEAFKRILPERQGEMRAEGLG